MKRIVSAVKGDDTVIYIGLYLVSTGMVYKRDSNISNKKRTNSSLDTS